MLDSMYHKAQLMNKWFFPPNAVLMDNSQLCHTSTKSLAMLSGGARRQMQNSQSKSHSTPTATLSRWSLQLLLRCIRHQLVRLRQSNYQLSKEPKLRQNLSLRSLRWWPALTKCGSSATSRVSSHRSIVNTWRPNGLSFRRTSSHGLSSSPNP